MEIVKVSTELYRLPLVRPTEDAGHGVMEEIELVVVAVETKEGIVGGGHTYTIGVGGCAIKGLIDSYLAAELIGEDPIMVEKIWNKLWWRTHWVGHGGLVSFAISALDIALWDIIAKNCEQPLYKVLGSYNPKIPMYASGVDLNLSDQELVRQVEDFLQDGYEAVKIKVGRDDPREDVRRVSKVRKAVGDKVKLYVDANMKWTVSQAIQTGRALEQCGIDWLEEPLVPEDVEGHRDVVAALSVPIAIGENLRTIGDFQHYISARAVDIIQLDVCVVGGITPWRKIAAAAEIHNLGVSSHHGEEIQAHLLASIPNAVIAERHAYRLDHVLREPLNFRDGYMFPSEVPGHGMVFDFEKLRPFQSS